MIRFYPPLSYEGSTLILSEVPDHLQHLRIKDFICEYVKGPWGYYIGQELALAECSCEIYIFDIKKAGPLFPSPKVVQFALQHLYTGKVFAEINQGVPVYLGKNYSEFIYLPLGVRQTGYFNKERVISLHFNYTEQFLRSNIKLFPFLKEFFERYDADPSLAQAFGQVTNDHIFTNAWDKFYKELKSSNSPERVIYVYARDLLAKYCEGLERQAEKLIRNEVDNSKYRPEHLTKIHRIKEIIESDYSLPHSYKGLSKAIALNENTMKTLFKQVYGKTIHQFVIDGRMTIAYDKIISTNDPIRDIARECGYENISHFIDLFRKKYKVDPSSLRIL